MRPGDSSDDDPSYNSPNSESSSLTDISSRENDQYRSSSANLCTKLRCLIESELLKGQQCLLCNHQPSEPLAALSCGFACPLCSNSTAEHCSISYQPLDLIGIRAIARLKSELAGLVILSPSEWVRHAFLATKRDQTLKSKRGPVISERIDISDRFERLVVVRNDDDAQSHDASDSDASSDGKRSEHSEHVKNYEDILASYLRVRSSSSGQMYVSTERNPSESLRLLRFLSRQNLARGTWLPVCSSDLLSLESDRTSINICMIGSSNLTRFGSIWRCSARSNKANLPLGCGRLFVEPELVRHCCNQTAPFAEFICPLCDCRLSKVIRLTAELTSN